MDFFFGGGDGEERRDRGIKERDPTTTKTDKPQLERESMVPTQRNGTVSRMKAKMTSDGLWIA